MCNNNSVPIHLSDGTILFLELLMLIMYAAIVLYFLKIKHWKTIRNLLITLIGVVLFELMIDPLVLNTQLSSWSYYFKDLNIIISFGWVLIVSVSITMVDFAFKHLSDFKRFWLYLCLLDFLTIPVEIFLVQSGVRVYSQSMLEASYGAFIPFTMVPFEVLFAVPMFFALVIAFTKYWEGILDANR